MKEDVEKKRPTDWAGTNEKWQHYLTRNKTHRQTGQSWYNEWWGQIMILSLSYVKRIWKKLLNMKQVWRASPVSKYLENGVWRQRKLKFNCIASVIRSNRKKMPDLPTRIESQYDLVVTCPDALPLSHRRLEAANAIQLWQTSCTGQKNGFAQICSLISMCNQMVTTEIRE